MNPPLRLRAFARSVLMAVSLAAASCSGSGVAHAADLGIEGQIFEPLEEDFRMTLLRLMAKHDWSEQQDELKQSAENYTKNLPSYYLPRATVTRTQWKDVGIVTTEDIYLPWVDWKTGSVFHPGRILAAPAGTYLNPISHIQARSIERLFIFDATDPDQMEFARALMVQNIPQLSFMVVAGDVGEMSKEMDRPIFHAIPTMLDKFHVEALPTLIGFGKGPHQGHMAITEFALPGTELSDIQKAWFGLPESGYDPSTLPDEAPADQQLPLPPEVRDAIAKGEFQPTPENLQMLEQSLPNHPTAVGSVVPQGSSQNGYAPYQGVESQPPGAPGVVAPAQQAPDAAQGVPVAPAAPAQAVAPPQTPQQAQPEQAPQYFQAAPSVDAQETQ
ncbi:hypothetical protein AB4Y45_32125 [Paraburkholderia sp. EG287A]|uniref:hypothetical protein n=1 Tax=Paraburkholderia sp. EG287A TaxID=3237012 RepID=UPI0034D27453